MYPSFNYIGSKIKLIDFISECIEKYTNKQLNEIKSFSDLFTGTGIVSFYMVSKGIPKIITNDMQYYSYIISSVLINHNLDIQKLNDIIKDLNNINCDNPSEKDFIYTHYTPSGDSNRMFLTSENGLKVDRIRQYIDQIKDTLTINEYNCLLKLLLYAVTKVSNTSSTYGAYLKIFKKSSKKELLLDIKLLNKLNSHKTNHLAFNKNILQHTFEYTEVCYLDPPYNTRKYSKNYDLLETIAKYDYPEIKGITGLRNETSVSSFCSKVTAKDDFRKLFNKINSKYIFMSYNSESLLSKEEIITLLQEKWTNVKCYEKEYKRFKSNKNCEQESKVTEYLFAGKLF